MSRQREVRDGTPSTPFQRTLAVPSSSISPAEHRSSRSTCAFRWRMSCETVWLETSYSTKERASFNQAAVRAGTLPSVRPLRRVEGQNVAQL